MKNIFTLILLFSTIILFSQNKKKIIYSEDSEINVVYTDSLIKQANSYGVFNTVNKHSKIFINGKWIKNLSLNSINPEKIKLVEIKKNIDKNDKENKYSNLFITLKSDYIPNFITIKELLVKYLELDNKSIIFQINNNVVNKDYNDYTVDEDFILKIELSKIITSKEKIDINLIKIITKTKENIKKANEIIIR